MPKPNSAWANLDPNTNALVVGTLQTNANLTGGYRPMLVITDSATNQVKAYPQVNNANFFYLGSEVEPNKTYYASAYIPNDTLAGVLNKAVTVSDFTAAQNEFIRQNLDGTFTNKVMTTGMGRFAADLNLNQTFGYFIIHCDFIFIYMKKTYLVTREQLDRIVTKYLDGMMKGGKIVETNPYDYLKTIEFINANDEVMLTLLQYNLEDEESDSVFFDATAKLSISENLVSFFIRNLGIREYKVVDLISDWFENTYDYEFDEIEVLPKI